MLKVIICEDENIIRRRIEASLKQISIKLDVEINVVLSTDNPIYAYEYSCNNECDIILLDIELNNQNMDGIKLAEKLRSIDKNILIIFISSHLEKIFESFISIPFDFIAKPSIDPHLEETIKRVLENKIYTPHGNFMKIKNSVVNLDTIIYIEKQLSKSIFYSDANVNEIYISFFQLLDCLPDNFIQISKSFIVNSNHINFINEVTRTIYLKNGKILTYSKKYIDNIGGIVNESNHKDFNH